MRQINKKEKIMVTEREYKIAKRSCVLCAIMITLATILICIIAYNYIINSESVHTHQFGIAIIDIALFITLLIRNRKIVKEWKEK